MQGGHIFARKDRPRRSSSLMKWDPYTIIVVISKSGNAKGKLYIDDGETFDYQKGAYIYRHFEYKDNILQSKDIGEKKKLTDAFTQRMKTVGIEKIIIVGAPNEWANLASVRINQREAPLKFHAESTGKSSWALIKTPNISIVDQWTISFPSVPESREL